MNTHSELVMCFGLLFLSVLCLGSDSDFFSFVSSSQRSVLGLFLPLAKNKNTETRMETEIYIFLPLVLYYVPENFYVYVSEARQGDIPRSICGGDVYVEIRWLAFFTEQTTKNRSQSICL